MEAVVVVGGAGYVGSHLSLTLYRQGYHVIIIDTYLHHQPFKPSWATLLHMPVEKSELIKERLQNYSIVALFHCAGLIEVAQSWKEPLLYYEQNLSATLAALKLCVDLQIPHFIFSSSCSLYDANSGLPLSETTPLLPQTPYAQTKAFGEKIIEDVCSVKKISYALLRYFNVAGAWPEEGLGECHRPETHVIPLLLEAALKEKSFKLYGNNYETKDGTAVRDYIHVRDVAMAHLQALQFLQKGGSSQPFNLGKGEGTTVGELAKVVEMCAGKKLAIERCPARRGDAPLLVADTTKAEKLLGWRPCYSSTEQIVETALTFMRKNESYR